VTRRIYLSIDFDYFTRELDEWDWGHSEGSSVYGELVWHTRVRFHEETSLDKHAVPHPRDFWNTLVAAGFNFDPCDSFTVADSHMWGAPDFLRLCPPTVEIVNFDAHHDMGYKPWADLKRDFLDVGRVDCSNWLLGLLHAREDITARVVYPAWKGTREIEKDSVMSWENAPITGRFRYDVYNEALLREMAGDVIGVFIAKSSTWTPPWHDRTFAKFAKAGADVTGIRPTVRYKAEERLNPLTPRKFDLPAALAKEREIQAAFASMTTRKAAGK
jgi:hypothetical protein